MVVPKKAWPKVAASSITQVLQVPYLALSILYVKSPKKKKKPTQCSVMKKDGITTFREKYVSLHFLTPKREGEELFDELEYHVWLAGYPLPNDSHISRF